MLGSGALWGEPVKLPPQKHSHKTFPGTGTQARFSIGTRLRRSTQRDCSSSGNNAFRSIDACGPRTRHPHQSFVSVMLGGGPEDMNAGTKAQQKSLSPMRGALKEQGRSWSILRMVSRLDHLRRNQRYRQRHRWAKAIGRLGRPGLCRGRNCMKLPHRNPVPRDTRRTILLPAYRRN